MIEPQIFLPNVKIKLKELEATVKLREILSNTESDAHIIIVHVNFKKSI